MGIAPPVMSLRLKKEAINGRHGRVIGCFIDPTCDTIIGVCPSCIEIFSLLNGERIALYNTLENITCAHHDFTKSLIVIGQE